MEKDLTLEVFASKEKIKKIPLHIYNLTSTKMGENYKVIRGAVWKIQNRNQCGVFENGKQIFTTEEIDTNIPNVDFVLHYEGIKEPEIIEDKRVYESYIKYLITKKLEQVKIFDKYRKYSCKNDITSSWILTENGYQIFSSRNKEISLQRKFHNS